MTDPRPLRALDLFCGAGGAGVGLARAGFQVVGVDIRPQPRYPFPFSQRDALTAPLEGFDFVWASPPCQKHTSMKHAPGAKGDANPDHIDAIRDRLLAWGGPFVIENVPGAPLRDPILLCGSMFGLEAAGFQLRRHRLFELHGFAFNPPPCAHGRGPVIGVYGGHVRCRSNARGWRSGADFPGQGKSELAHRAMGLPHRMTMHEISEAIPPAYSEAIARAALAAMLSASAA